MGFDRHVAAAGPHFGRPSGLYHGHGGIEVGLIVIGQYDMGTFGSEALGHGQPNAAGPAGDDGYFVLKSRARELLKGLQAGHLYNSELIIEMIQADAASHDFQPYYLRGSEVFEVHPQAAQGIAVRHY